MTERGLRSVACVVAVVALPAACVIAPPAEPPTLPAQGPTIVPETADPPVSEDLTALPVGGFEVEVRTVDAVQPIFAAIIVDPELLRPIPIEHKFTPAVNGGPTLIDVPLSVESLGDPAACHVIELVVAYDDSLFSAPSIGAQISTIDWQYTPGGPGSCEVYDAGDGAYQDSPSDVFVGPI